MRQWINLHITNNEWVRRDRNEVAAIQNPPKLPCFTTVELCSRQAAVTALSFLGFKNWTSLSRSSSAAISSPYKPTVRLKPRLGTERLPSLVIWLPQLTGNSLPFSSLPYLFLYAFLHKYTPRHLYLYTFSPPSTLICWLCKNSSLPLCLCAEERRE